MAVLTDLDKSVGNLLGSGVAKVGELADVLERVGAVRTAEVLDALDHNTEAVEVLGDLGGVGGLLEVGGEESINELTVSELNLEGCVSLWGALVDDVVVFHVQVVVTGVNVLLRAGLSGNSLLVEVSGLGNEGLGKSSIVGAGALKVTNWHFHEGEVAELHDGRLGSLGLDGSELLSKGLDADIVGLSVLHPVDGEQISEARADVGTIDVGLGAAVSAP